MTAWSVLHDALLLEAIEPMDNTLSLMTIADFSERTGLAESTVRKWLREKRIAHVKLGSAVRIPATELDRLVVSNLRPAEVTAR